MLMFKCSDLEIKHTLPSNQKVEVKRTWPSQTRLMSNEIGAGFVLS